MTEYLVHPTFLKVPHDKALSHVVAQRKAARKKLLAEVEQRRRENYLRWHKKMQLKKASELDTIMPTYE